MDGTGSHINLKEDPRFVLELRTLLSTPGGRYVFRGLLSACGVRRTTFTGNALSGAYAQGMQNAGLLIEDLISTAAFELFLQMLKEHNDESVIGTAEKSGGRNRVSTSARVFNPVRGRSYDDDPIDPAG